MKILLVLGGNWHDFDGFATAFRGYFAEHDGEIVATHDADQLLTLEKEGIDLVALYTCLGGSNQQGRIAEDMTPAQVQALAAWVEGGGRLLALHAATVMREENATLRHLLGGRFLSHPPQFDFTLLPLFREHPITAGVGAFTVHDEFYIQTYAAEVDLHMVAAERGVAYPMLWTKQAGQGSVVYLAPGHSAAVWDLAPYRQLVRQSVQWLAAQSIQG